jgi:hypothetical protein
MKFMCLGYFDQEKMDSRPSAEIEAVMKECTPHLENVYHSGKVVLDAGLETRSKNIRLKNGKTIVTDGPFLETKELVGGVFIVEAKDMDEAIHIACLHPTIQIKAGEQFGWGLEIRPIHSFEDKTGKKL